MTECSRPMVTTATVYKTAFQKAIVRLGLLVSVIIALATANTAVLAADMRPSVMDRCNDTDADHLQAAMIGGIAMGLLFGQSLGGPKRQYCPPNSGRLSPGQYRVAVCRFLTAHPKVAAEDEYTAVGIALLEVYPCSPEHQPSTPPEKK